MNGSASGSSDFDEVAAIPMDWEPSVTIDQIKTYRHESSGNDRDWMLMMLMILALTPEKLMEHIRKEGVAVLETADALTALKERLESSVELIECAVARLMVAMHHWVAETEAA